MPVPLVPLRWEQRWYGREMSEISGLAGNTISRREWLRHAPLPVIGVAVGAAGALPKQAGAQVTDRAGGHAGAMFAPGARTYDITAFGAKGDKVALCTTAVQAAVDACHNDGGGTVVVKFPP